MRVACVALLFATTGAARRMDMHALSGHGSHFGNSVTDAAPAASHHAHGSHAGHHQVVEQQEAGEPGQAPQPNECTCVGPCQGGVAPNVTRPAAYVVAAQEVRSKPQVAKTLLLVRRDPTSHLLPLPNAPPARV
ncbi:MAG: hypothetical protein AB7T31_02305 [Gemmatimonadales bacterium]